MFSPSQIRRKSIDNEAASLKQGEIWVPGPNNLLKHQTYILGGIGTPHATKDILCSTKQVQVLIVDSGANCNVIRNNDRRLIRRLTSHQRA